VKYAYTRIFTPNWTADQVSFVQDKISQYNYSITLKDSFSLSLCSRCNNGLLRLNLAKKKSFVKSKFTSNLTKNDTKTSSELQVSKKIKLEPKLYDLTLDDE
ncbi:25419_t:CDS:1, partial [Racocetra persica]